jgi:hypothetical protein
LLPRVDFKKLPRVFHIAPSPPAVMNLVRALAMTQSGVKWVSTIPG